jgi:DNA-binding GntR family transcriptional regulator
MAAARKPRKTAGATSRGRVTGDGGLAPGGSLVEFAADRVRQSILHGDLPPGERVLLDDLAADLGISAIPVREALRIVATEGLVVPVARRGYTVAPVRVKDLEETYRLRLLLEPLAVSLAVPRLTPAELSQLDEELEGLAAAFAESDWPAHRIHHRAFHFGIYEKCNSTWLLRFTEMLWTNSERYQFMTTRIRGELTERLSEHRKILKACKAGDPEKAAALMHDHLSLAAKSLARFIAEHEDVEPSPADESDGIAVPS